LPKSALASTPESTIAIAGACGAGPVISPVAGSNEFCRIDMSVESSHMVASWYSATRTGTFRVIAATCEFVASFRRSLPRMDAWTPFTDTNLCLSLPFSFKTSLPVSETDRSRLP
jgi:hypothetical protein